MVPKKKRQNRILRFSMGWIVFLPANSSSSLMAAMERWLESSIAFLLFSQIAYFLESNGKVW